MDDYAVYSIKDVNDQFNAGLKQGILLAGTFGIIGIMATLFVCYERFGPPSKVPNLSLLIGDIQRVKDDSEGIVFSLRSRWNARILSDTQVRDGAGRYHELASRFNGLSASLEAMLSTGHDDASVETLRLSLADAQQQYQGFRAWFNSLPRERPTAQQAPPGQPTKEISYGDATDVVGPAIDLAKHFFDGMKEMDKIKRDHLIGMIQNLRFQSWPDAFNGAPGSAPAPGQNLLPPPPPAR